MLSRFLKRDKKEEKQNTQDVNLLISEQQKYFMDNVKQISDSLANITKAIRNLEARTQDISERLEGISERVEAHENEITNIKDAVEKMFVLYDIVMKQYNPFLEEDTKKPEIINNSEPDKMEIESKLEDKTKFLPLDEIKEDPAFIAIVMGWLNYLVSKSSIKETMKALDYYEDIGWITEKVKIKLEKYLEGYDDSDSFNKQLTPEDHLISLYIISKLKSGIDKGVIRFKDLYEELIDKGMIKPIRKR